MADFLEFLQTHTTGILLLIAIALTLLIIIQWLAWIFRLGRFSASPSRTPGREGIRYIVMDLIVKIIDDFRHFLALLIVVLFFLALGYALLRAGSDVEAISDALQAVSSALGGLIGAIIGYYFGESAGRKRDDESVAGPPAESVQEGGPEDETITPVGLPPHLETSGDKVPKRDESSGDE
jgi:hypothetical protein